MKNNSICNPMKKGDVLWMGYRRRTFWQWLTGRQSKPQWWQLMDDCEPGGISRMEKISDPNNQ